MVTGVGNTTPGERGAVSGAAGKWMVIGAPDDDGGRRRERHPGPGPGTEEWDDGSLTSSTSIEDMRLPQM